MNKIYDLTFKHPARWIIFGPSESGKTLFTFKFIEKLNDLFNVKFDRIIYCSETKLPSYGLKYKIETCSNLNDDLINSFDSNKNNFLIIDDQLEEIIENPLMSVLFTRKSSHFNITVFFLTQNLFPKSKYMRNITINATYVVLMRNPGERLQIRLFSNRISEDKSDKRFLESYKLATEKPYSYLLVDQSQNIPQILKYRTEFLNNENFQIVFI